DCSRPPPRAGTRTQATTVSLCTSSPPHRSISVSILLPSAVRRSLSSRSLRCVLVATVLSPPRLPRLTHRRAHWRQGASTSPDGGGNFHQLRVGRKGPWILIGAATAPPPPRCALRPARVRHVFRRHAEIKRAMGFRRFIFRGVTKVRDEWDLPCAALNLRRLRALGVAAASHGRPRAANRRSVTAQHGSGGAVGAPMRRRTGRSLPDPCPAAPNRSGDGAPAPVHGSLGSRS